MKQGFQATEYAGPGDGDGSPPRGGRGQALGDEIPMPSASASQRKASRVARTSAVDSGTEEDDAHTNGHTNGHSSSSSSGGSSQGDHLPLRSTRKIASKSRGSLRG